ncbi:MAG TPA: TonB-dependent receptor [Candidatus Limnocylindria bacterium]|nr:TonB-dependent receptor [Candidatus Limnocylindria bacterium]
MTALLALVLCISSMIAPAWAGTTGTISGTVTDLTTGKPLAGVTVDAASPTQSEHTTTNAQGFYVLQNLNPDTYVVSYTTSGYETYVVQGITVQQDITTALNEGLAHQLRSIGGVSATSAQNLVKGTEGTDVYSISGQQLNAASGGDDLHKTLYQYIATAPGVTTNGFPGLPRIRGGTATDTGYELDGIPVRERITGLFTSNLSSIGFQNVEVYTGGLSAENAGNGTGIINTVVKSGTAPGFTNVSVGVTAQEMNNYLTFEKGGASQNGRFSYYISADIANSNNAFDYGNVSFPNVLYQGADGPGPTYTRDLMGNFHYRPNQNNDIQFLIQNGYGVFDYDYMLGPETGTHLAVTACPGESGGAGGTAPNGQPCPNGLYYRALAPNTGNTWYHYSGIGKLQWNHIINDTSGITFRLAENFNQYIFDQPITDVNTPGMSTGVKGCPAYPYTPNSPVTMSGGALCSAGVENFYEDRRSNMYFGSADYTNTLNENVTLKAGIGQEYDNNMFVEWDPSAFNANGTYPEITGLSVVPTHFPYAYVDTAINAGRFTLDPGLRYSEGLYEFPGSHPITMLTPTFSGTYRINPRNVLRYSYADTSNYVGTLYVYRQNSTTYNPGATDSSYDPQLNHSAEVMWEHALNPSTSFRFGPWMRSTSNYFALYRPFLGYNTAGNPTFGPTSPTNAGANRVFGLELGANHVDNHSVGLSWFLGADYENYWTTAISTLTGSYGASQLPANIVNSGVMIRSTADPMLNATLTMDAHAGSWSFLPLVTYQVDTFYNVGILNTAQTQITQPEMIAGGHWVANATLLKHLNRNATLGLYVTNLTNNLHDTTPCLNNAQGTGCNPYSGPGSGVNGQPNQYIWENYSQTPRMVELFLTVKGG